MWFFKLYAHQVVVCTRNLNPRCYGLERRSWIPIIHIKMVKLRLKFLWLFIIKLTLFLDGSFKAMFTPERHCTVIVLVCFFHLSMADNVIASRCSAVIYPHLLLSPSHFQNSLSTFSIERVNGVPLWDICERNFQRALKIIIIAELFIVMTISPG